jgi:hypothetical protein
MEWDGLRLGAHRAPAPFELVITDSLSDSGQGFGVRGHLTRVAPLQDLSGLSSEQARDWLRSQGLVHVAKAFEQENVAGSDLAAMATVCTISRPSRPMALALRAKCLTAASHLTGYGVVGRHGPGVRAVAERSRGAAQSTPFIDRGKRSRDGPGPGRPECPAVVGRGASNVTSAICVHDIERSSGCGVAWVPLALNQRNQMPSPRLGCRISAAIWREWSRRRWRWSTAPCPSSIRPASRCTDSPPCLRCPK